MSHKTRNFLHVSIDITEDLVNTHAEVMYCLVVISANGFRNKAGLECLHWQ